jgi:hypothetical protein
MFRALELQLLRLERWSFSDGVRMRITPDYDRVCVALSIVALV